MLLLLPPLPSYLRCQRSLIRTAKKIVPEQLRLQADEKTASKR
jgi:hypothetical protein